MPAGKKKVSKSEESVASSNQGDGKDIHNY